MSALRQAAAEAIAGATALSHAMLDELRQTAPSHYAAADTLMAMGGHLELRFTLAVEAPGASLVVQMPDGQAHVLASTQRATDARWPCGQH
jgi:hypothetical protein